MILLAEKSGTPCRSSRLACVDVWVVVLEFIVLIALMISLGPVFRALAECMGLAALDRRRHRRHAPASGTFLAFRSG